MEFDFDEWPDIHTNCTSYLKPYNNSIFDLRYSYSTIFPEPELEPVPDDLNEPKSLVRDSNPIMKKLDKNKIYKIKYKLNLLPEIGMHALKTKDGPKYFNKDISIISLCT